MRTRWTLLLLLLVPGIVLADDSLDGLWKAKRRFGPDAGGTLVIRRHGAIFDADLSGRAVAVTVDKGEITFRSPDGAGSFRGRIEPDKTILGHWTKPASLVNGAYATPVVLRPDAENRWRADVDPFTDEFTFYLLLRRQPDGNYSALLRNLDRDIGAQYGVNALVSDANGFRLMGKRGEVARGTYHGSVLTLFFPGRGGSYDFARDDGNHGFYPRDAAPAAYSYRPPVSTDDGWPTGSLDDAGISRASIEQLVQSILAAPMDSPDAPQVHALLIARHGKLVLEEYFHGDTRETLHDTRSAGKSVTSIVAGAAMRSGVPITLQSRVYDVMKEGGPTAADDLRKQSMTLENLLTMSSGFFCDDTNDAAPGNEETMNEQTEEPDYYRYTLRVPMATAPGENSVYCSAGANLALGMVGRTAAELPLYTFDRLVGEPMGITHYAWPLDPLGRPYGGGGLRLRARDFAKFGQMMLDGGVWNGHRIMNRDYAERAASPLYHLRNIEYGYLFWGERYPYKARTLYAYSARGSGGQTVTVVPELDLVITTMAGNYFSRKGMFAASTDMVPQRILPAVREPGDDPTAPVVAREFVSPYGASKDGSRVTKEHP